MRQHAVVTRGTAGPSPRPRFALRLHARLLPRVDPTFLAQTLFLALAHVEVPGDDLNMCGVEVRPAAEEVQLPLAVVSITRGAQQLTDELLQLNRSDDNHSAEPYLRRK